MVLLARYRGTDVAVKRVLPPQKSFVFDKMQRVEQAGDDRHGITTKGTRAKTRGRESVADLSCGGGDKKMDDFPTKPDET